MEKKSQGAALSPSEAFELLGGRAVISRASFYAGLNRRDIPCKRIGRRFIIPRFAFTKWLEEVGQPEAAGK